ncbi:MAG: tetratricopeptide repeat protein [Spirochaetaceae bacterium]|jgi:tetratricopeptide (TPR) repeat protein|nr:tetratricopeptide repeat protein [Spirochaetaceae bacterium]
MIRRFCGIALIIICCAQLGAQTGRDAVFYYEQGREALLEGDWYAAAEAFLECLRRNPAHTGATRSLAEAYYELGEYDEALTWVRKARILARLDAETANLEASILIALGKLSEADVIVKDVLRREPYNRDALFVASELDIARGHPGDAVIRYKNAVRLYGDDRRLLVSLALVLGSLGDYTGAAEYIERAQTEHPGDYRVFYFAAYLAARSGKIAQAIRDAERSLFLRPSYTAARDLLASLKYRAGDYTEAITLADQAITANRKNISAWFLKGMAFWRQGRLNDARSILQTARNIDGEDEFVRAAYEELLISGTALESPERATQARYHFQRAADFKRRNLSNEALFEYRRGLRINPYADERRDYAELLRIQGYPALQLEELKFIVDLGKGSRPVNDAIETWTNRLASSLSRQWPVEPDEIQRHWNVAVFAIAGQSAFYHTDAGFIAANYLKDIMSHSRKVNMLDLELREANFAAAFRTARQASAQGTPCDYFLLVSISENERDLAFKNELFVARTGAKAAEWTVFRAGQDRLRNAALNSAARLEAALPFRAVLLRRNADRALADKGKIDGITPETVLTVIRKGRLELQNSGLGFKYAEADVAGTLAITNIDEEVSAGKLTRQGFFDVISVGDDLIIQSEQEKTTTSQPPPTAPASDPELRALLMTLRAP